jgi:hypothetical protein
MEHPVPEALQGNYELPQASCNKCREITAAFEAIVIDKMFKTSRAELNVYGKRFRRRPLHRRREADRPNVTFNHRDGTKTIVSLKPSEYPFLSIWPIFDAPGVLSGKKPDLPFPPMFNDAKRQWIVWPNDFEERRAALFKAYAPDAESFTVGGQLPIIEFCRLLAKIAYAATMGIADISATRETVFALANLMKLTDFIRGVPGAPLAPFFVGCAFTADGSRITSLGTKGALHETVCFTHPYLVDLQVFYTRIQLFAAMATPVYEVVTGVLRNEQSL